MNPGQAVLFYVLGVLGFAALLGVPQAELAGAAFVGAWVSVAGLALELADT